MDDWEKFNETILPKKEEFYSNLNMKEITDADCVYGTRVCKGFGIKNLGECHNLYLKSDTLLLAVFENFRKMFKNLQIRSSKISFGSWISMVSSFKNDKSKIRTIA